MAKVLDIAVVALLAWGCASKPTAPKAVRPCVEFDHGHGDLARVLSEHVSKGKVDYKGIIAGGREHLERYLISVESICKRDYQSWSRDQKLAFWINVYNAYTIDLILDNYPLGSIREIGVFPAAAWREKIVRVPHFYDETLSLFHVENEIIRARFKEPRIHFALVCASGGCPPLRSEPFTAGNLDDQLESQTVAFLNDGEKNRYDAGANHLYLSKIFDWYPEDFGGDKQLAAYVAKYLDTLEQRAAATSEVVVEFLPYDWSLNEKR